MYRSWPLIGVNEPPLFEWIGVRRKMIGDCWRVQTRT